MEPPSVMADAYAKPQLTEYEAWNDTWVRAIVSGDCTQEEVVKSINQLLSEELQRLHNVEGVRNNFLNFLWNADWSPRPDKLDNIWRGNFEAAEERGWKESVRDALFYWAECYLQGGASDVGFPQEACSAEEGGDDDEVQHAFVTPRAKGLSSSGRPPGMDTLSSSAPSCDKICDRCRHPG